MPRAVLAPDRYDIFGYAAELLVADPEARRAVRWILRDFAQPAGGVGEQVARYVLSPPDGASGTAAWSLRLDGALLHTDPDLPAALVSLEWQVFTDALAARPDLFHLHGAALAPPAGREALLLIGPSGSGKTTLTLALMLAGLAPYGDDVILIEPATLAVRSVPRAFHIEPGTRELLAPLGPPVDWRFDAGPLGYFLPPRWATDPRPIRCVLFPEVRPGAAPRLVPLTPAEAAAALLGQTASLVRTPRVALPTVARLTRQAACYRLVAGDLAASVDVVQRLLADSPAPPPSPPRRRNDHPPGAPGPGRGRATPGQPGQGCASVGGGPNDAKMAPVGGASGEAMTMEGHMVTAPPAFLPPDGIPRREACVQDELLPDGSLILYNACRHQVLTVNPTAALVWECCDGQHDVAAIAAELREAFPTVPSLERDVLGLLLALAQAGMLFPPAA